MFSSSVTSRGIGALSAILFAAANILLAQDLTVTCSSSSAGKQHCPADTSAGVALQRSLGTAECLPGKTWGYDGNGVWVADGCSGEFVLGPSTPAPAPAQGEPESLAMWGSLEPGKGFLVGRNDLGELYISAYALVRYLNQLPADQTFTDHLGGVRPVLDRNDFYAHRIMIILNGWIGLPKLRYHVLVWAVNTTDQNAVFAVIGYQFNKEFSLYGGLNGLPGTRSLQGSHPYWLAHDRVMADEFFRPFFTNGVWANGEILPGLWYLGMVGNNLSNLGVSARQLTRQLSTGGSIWWMPTTKEFGARGGYSDWEYHDRIATRFGVSTTRSREDRFGNLVSNIPDNNALRLADSLNLFETGALAPGVTVQTADYRLIAFDAGMKYRGIFLQTELYTRRLDDFVADGPLPVTSIVDKGFYVQAAFFPIPKKLELYAATSQIFGDKGAGFRNSNEYLGGLNLYLANSPNYRINSQVIRVNRSPVSSTFGYYVGGQKGTTVSVGVSFFF